MYQSLLIITALATSVSASNSPKNESQKIIAGYYSTYTKNKNDFLKSSLSKQNIHGRITEFLEKSEEILTKIEAAEKAQYPNESERVLSEQGSIIALETSILDPLLHFAESAMEADDCKRTLFDISLDKNNDADNFANVVESVVKKICR
jgi:hypothetical protein